MTPTTPLLSLFRLFRAVTFAAAMILLPACESMPSGGGDGGNENGNGGNGNSNGDGGSGEPAAFVWSAAFDSSNVGALSSVWGSGPSDVFIVGGTPGVGEVYHFDGDEWSTMDIPDVPLLVWVFGVGPDDVYAVGEDGGFIRYDGTTWSIVASGTSEDLWGVWGASPDELWIVGGSVDTPDPVILRYNGQSIENIPVPENDRNAAALFKVWGIGTKVFAVGEAGLIIELQNGTWQQVPTGPAANDDFVSLWGTSEDNIVAVGGRSSARIAVYSGGAWSTQLASGIPGLNAVFMVDPNEAIIGGENAYIGNFDPISNRLSREENPESRTIHAIWADGAGRYYAVGGRFSVPYTGLALVRTIGQPDFEVRPPTGVEGGSGDQPTDDPIDEPIDNVGDDPRLLLGVSNGEPFMELSDGDDMQLFSLGQGGVHLFLSYRLIGFEPNAEVNITASAVRSEDGETAIEEFTQSDFVTDIGDGLNERIDRLIRIDSLFPSEIVEREIDLTVTITDAEDPTLSVSGRVTLLLRQPT